MCASKFLYPSAKAGHWETEKAGYKNADNLSIWCESQDLLWCYLVSAFGSIEVMFLCVGWLIHKMWIHHRKTQAVVIFGMKITAVFYLL